MKTAPTLVRSSPTCAKRYSPTPTKERGGAEGEPPLPVHPVTLSSLLFLPFGPPYVFRQATERAVDSAADLRWGPDRKGFRRLVHPNGICLTGLWQITEDTRYSGYFRNGSRAVIVGRYSTCCRETRRGHVRSLSLVGKLFPTAAPGFFPRPETGLEPLGGSDRIRPILDDDAKDPMDRNKVANDSPKNSGRLMSPRIRSNRARIEGCDFLSAEDKEKILWRNALTFLGIERLAATPSRVAM